jgi:predicted ATP-dependent serine protease
MAKSKIAYFCQSCGYESAKWLGKCPSCQQWNTFVEEILEKSLLRKNTACLRPIKSLTAF